MQQQQQHHEMPSVGRSAKPHKLERVQLCSTPQVKDEVEGGHEAKEVQPAKALGVALLHGKGAAGLSERPQLSIACTMLLLRAPCSSAARCSPTTTTHMLLLDFCLQDDPHNEERHRKQVQTHKSAPACVMGVGCGL